MTGVRRAMTAAITLLSAALMLDSGWMAAAHVASGTHVTVERGKPSVKQPSPKPTARQTREVTVATNKYGIGIGSRTRRTETRTYERRGPEDVDRPVDRARRVGREVVARRALTVEERALGQARRRAECLATLARVSRIYRETGRGPRLSADRCHILEDPAEPVVVVITDAVVLAEVKNVGFQSSAVQVQPRDRTLVNLGTNFYAEPRRFDRAIPIQGQLIPVRATPTYTWHFGDGTTRTTTSAGAPYPDGDVTHHYRERGKVVVSVTLNHATWYRLPGNDWRYAGVVDIPGPGTAIQVCEARPVLTDPDSDYQQEADATNPCTV